MFFFPEGGGYFIEMANFEEANPLVTPDHIAPVWYYCSVLYNVKGFQIPWWLNSYGISSSNICLLFHGLIRVKLHQ
jgi:ubiquinol-cytochrome c reductase cytochrome b subunit